MTKRKLSDLYSAKYPHSWSFMISCFLRRPFLRPIIDKTDFPEIANFPKSWISQIAKNAKFSIKQAQFLIPRTTSGYNWGSKKHIPQIEHGPVGNYHGAKNTPVGKSSGEKYNRPIIMGVSIFLGSFFLGYTIFLGYYYWCLFQKRTGISAGLYWSSYSNQRSYPRYTVYKYRLIRLYALSIPTAILGLIYRSIVIPDPSWDTQLVRVYRQGIPDQTRGGTCSHLVSPSTHAKRIPQRDTFCALENTTVLSVRDTLEY